MTLTIATCQFPVTDDPRRNAAWVRRQMRSARAQGAHVAHFGEACLSGYAGPDLASYEGYDWPLLRSCTEGVLELARELGLWVVVGSAHPLSGRRKPHNSVYVIDDRGRLVDRYDKRFCAGDRSGSVGDLAHYTPGDHMAVFRIRGVRCGVLVCHEYRYPELHRAYKKQRVDVIFHSYHTGNIPPAIRKAMRAGVGEANVRRSGGANLPEITMPASMIAAAASSHLWISCSNSSAPESCWPAFFVRPDGVVTGRLRRNRAGVLISTVDPEVALYDSTVAWRGRAMDGRFHSGRLVRDARSRARTEL